MKNETTINTEHQAGINKLLNAVVPTPKLSTDGIALDCAEGSRGNGIGATSKECLLVLVACEESQEVTKAFRELGHEAYSCDLIDCSGGHPEWHIKGDAIDILYSRKWDLVIAHPPCTRLCLSGVMWLHKRKLWYQLKDAINFFREFQLYAEYGNAVAIENPIPHKYAKDGFWINEYVPQTKPELIFGIGKPTQKVQPFHFGHGERKATCFWLYNLKPLIPTNFVWGREQKLHRLPPSKDRAKLRSKTYSGIAKAMAQQWGGNVQKNDVYV